MRGQIAISAAAQNKHTEATQIAKSKIAIKQIHDTDERFISGCVGAE
jgi:hypothetical protein